MAFGGLIGKETQVDLSQYVTETELNSKGFATQSWVTQQLPNLPEGFGEVIRVDCTRGESSEVAVNPNGVYLIYVETKNKYMYNPIIFTPAYAYSGNNSQAIFIGSEDFNIILNIKWDYSDRSHFTFSMSNNDSYINLYRLC